MFYEFLIKKRPPSLLVNSLSHNPAWTYFHALISVIRVIFMSFKGEKVINWQYLTKKLLHTNAAAGGDPQGD